MRKAVRFACAAGASLLAALFAATAVRAAPADAAHQALYREGVLADGSALLGRREGGDLRGAAAACVNCHRRSGLGASEGRLTVPPITGAFLFKPRGTYVQAFEAGASKNQRAWRDAYDDASLARAIREGVDPAGRTLSPVMPRYRIPDAEVHELAAYLRGLSAQLPPGVERDTLHFATIVTPDADPVEKAAMLDVMRKFFEDKNAFIRGGSRPMPGGREIQYRVQRRWQLHVWELEGPSSGWQAQLEAKLAAEPVFAVISGLGRAEWRPVHQFCERRALPCLFPNVDLPVDAEGDFYPLYFSRGVHLEAALLAARLAAGDATRPVVQVFRSGDIGESAAADLARHAAARGLRVVSRALAPSGDANAQLASALGGLPAGARVVLWLRERDLQELPPAAPDEVFLSGLMAGLDGVKLPTAWEGFAHWTYPVELPDRRRVGVTYAMSWFRIRGIAVKALRVQTDTYIACGILAEALNDMLEDFYRDYLVERIETMLSHRLVTGYYPRLSLAPGQRFASKGGYIVHRGTTEDSVLPEGEWSVPALEGGGS